MTLLPESFQEDSYLTLGKQIVKPQELSKPGLVPGKVISTLIIALLVDDVFIHFD